MQSGNVMMQNKEMTYGKEKPDLRNAKLLYFLMAVLYIADWIFPQYFGIHFGFDFTITRIMNVLIVIYFCFNPLAGKHFLKSMLDVQVTPYLALYMVVMMYTAILRVNVNTFFLNFLDILTFYMVYYGIRYVFGVKKMMKWTVVIAWIFGIYGLVEYVLGYSPLLKYLQTVPSDSIVDYRSGLYRIMGPCVHSIAYGMFLLILIAIISIDYERDEMYLFQHPILYGVLVINIFLTGSRGSLGLVLLESVLIMLFSTGNKKKKTFLMLVVAIISFALIVGITYSTSFGQYIMIQITSVIDEVLGTEYATHFGANTLLLEQSSSYREYLPRVFTVDWLNPFVGRGANAHVTFEFDGVFVKSIDNFYVAAYIRYAYPGLITYSLFFIATAFFMLKTGFQQHSGLCKALAIGFIIYCGSLFFVDYLQTTKYMYILVALYAAYYSETRITSK